MTDSQTNSGPMKARELTCGNCGFAGNPHELEVHAAIRHMGCDDRDCQACRMKDSGVGGRG
jgi:hypothetical protein